MGGHHESVALRLVPHGLVSDDMLPVRTFLLADILRLVGGLQVPESRLVRLRSKQYSVLCLLLLVLLPLLLGELALEVVALIGAALRVLTSLALK